MTKEEFFAHMKNRFTIRSGQPGTEYVTIKGGPFETEEQAVANWLDQFNARFGIDTRGALEWIKPSFSLLGEQKAFTMRPAGWYSHGRARLG